MRCNVSDLRCRMPVLLAIAASPLWIAASVRVLAAQEDGASQPAQEKAADQGRDGNGDGPPVFSHQRSGQVLIVIGLPGDREHAERFAGIERHWIEWLTGPLGFAPGQLTILSGRAARAADSGTTDSPASDSPASDSPASDSPASDSPANDAPASGSGNGDGELADAGGGARSPAAPIRGPATRRSLENTLQRLSGSLRKDDRLWVLLLGHGNYDGQRAFFHLPGPDVSDRDLGLLFAEVDCAEQVFWLTNSCSGWMVQGLAKPGRIVIAATEADLETNETEFPAALATVSRQSDPSLDENSDGRVSVLEVFAATVGQVAAAFEAEQLAPTEHAQLDDNGDGKGTELPELAGRAGREAKDAQPAGVEEAARPDEKASDAKGPVTAAVEPPADSESSALPESADGFGAPPAPAKRPEDGQRAARTFLWQAKPPVDEQRPRDSARDERDE